MSKELEAIEARQALHMIERSVGEHGWFGCEEVETLEAAINELEDLRHNYKAVEEMLNNSAAYGAKIQAELNELKKDVGRYIKRNEPIKPTLDEDSNYRCARCHHMVDNHYCSDCGGAVDWSDEV